METKKIVRENRNSALISKRKSPTQERSKRTYAAILEGAARVLDAGDPFTTNHVAAASHLSVGSLYQYFPNAESILAALIQAHVETEVSAVTELLEKPFDDPETLISELVDAFINVHSQAPTISRRLHETAPVFGLDTYLHEARNLQADAIAAKLKMDKDTIRILVAAVEGAVLAQLGQQADLDSPAFREIVTKIAKSTLLSE